MKAENFSLVDQEGKTHKLQDYLGQWVVLYFYPKDDTPGCTKEACNFRDTIQEIQKLGAVVLGVSKDSVASHKKFVEKYNLNFLLLANEDLTVIKKYEAWGEKKFLGKTFMGTLRKSFLIDPKGEIKKVYTNVNPTQHASEVIDDLKKFANPN